MENVANPKHLTIVGKTYYVQMRVPSDLAGTYGRILEKRSLKTKDRREAERRSHLVIAEIESKFAAHREALKKNVPGDGFVGADRNFAEISRSFANEILDREVTARADLYESAVVNPRGFFKGQITPLPTGPQDFTYYDKLVADGDLDRIVGYLVRNRLRQRIAEVRRMVDTGDLAEMAKVARQRSPGLERKAVIVLALSLAHSEIRALQSCLSGADPTQHDEGEPSRASPSQSALNSISTALDFNAISLDSLFEKWKTETKPTANTLSTWRGVLKSLVAFLPSKAQHAGSISSEDIIGWKDDLVKRGLSPKTINASYLACVRTIFNFGVSNKLISVNTADGVKVSAGKSGAKGSKSSLPYTNSEVARLLTLSKQETKPAMRWLPWLAAQTGSRIGEVAQLQASYVKEEEGIYFLDIQPAPDGGTLKEEVSARTVPLHPKLIEDGFLEFVASRAGKPLFYNRSSGDREKRHASKSVASRLAAWIRGNGFQDKRKKPNHAFRHWFKGYGDQMGISNRMVDLLSGHSPRSVGDMYFFPELREKRLAIEKLALPPANDIKPGATKEFPK